METAGLPGIIKTITHRGGEPRTYLWRTATGTEVDIPVETGGKLVPLEVKLNATPGPAMAGGIRVFRKESGATGYVIHPGSLSLPPGSGVTALPYTRL